MARAIGNLAMFAASIGTLSIAGALIYGLATKELPGGPAHGALIGVFIACLIVSSIVTISKVFED